MDEARDLGLVSIPFAVGAAAGLHMPWQAGVPALCLTGACIFLTSKRRSDDYIIPLLFLFLGIFCGISGRETSLHASGPAGNAAERLRSLIDSIPFAYERSGPLVKALLTGDRSGLDSGTISVFRASGASHILALSGLHLGLIHLMIKRCAAILGNSRAACIIRASLTTACAGFYTLMTGASPSTVRAFLFIAAGEWAGVSPGRRGSPKRSLLLALTIQSALSPASLESVSFQMSYLAMCGIVFILPGLQKWYPDGGKRAGLMRRIWNAAALSISCQIFTAPLAWMRFHTFPKYFLLTNILALPLSSAAMAVSALTIALHAIGLCPEALVHADDMLIQALVYVLETISGM